MTGAGAAARRHRGHGQPVLPQDGRGARLIGAAWAEARYLPPYRPDLDPIEQLFNKLEAWQREAKVRTVDTVIEALRAVRPADALG